MIRYIRFKNYKAFSNWEEIELRPVTLIIGKNSSGSAQEWYILGKDTGVSGDNTIIFAASPIATGQLFENDYSNNKTFETNFGVYETHPSEVYPNHYGASDLRVALQRMLKDDDGNF